MAMVAIARNGKVAINSWNGTGAGPYSPVIRGRPFKAEENELALILEGPLGSCPGALSSWLNARFRALAHLWQGGAALFADPHHPAAWAEDHAPEHVAAADALTGLLTRLCLVAAGELGPFRLFRHVGFSLLS